MCRCTLGNCQTSFCACFVKHKKCIDCWCVACANRTQPKTKPKPTEKLEASLSITMKTEGSQTTNTQVINTTTTVAARVTTTNQPCSQVIQISNPVSALTKYQHFAKYEQPSGKKESRVSVDQSNTKPAVKKTHKCTCKTGCKNARCGCVKIAEICDPTCKCTGCDNRGTNIRGDKGDVNNKQPIRQTDEESTAPESRAQIQGPSVMPSIDIVLKFPEMSVKRGVNCSCTGCRCAGDCDKNCPCEALGEPCHSSECLNGQIKSERDINIPIVLVLKLI